MALERRIDMHAHTTASDGALAPAELVKLAASLSLAGVAVTDHDTISGLAEAHAAAKQYNIALLPGIEISTVAEGKDIHVLGYFVNAQDELWQQRICKLGATREARNEQLFIKLNQLGITITLDEVVAISGDQGSIGRPHVAQVLINKGIVATKQQAFEEYLGEGGKAFVQPVRIHPTEAFQWIREAAGVCVLAHPGLYEDDELVEQLLIAGPDGIEVNHSDHSEEQVQYYKSLARKYQLIETAGSDFHSLEDNSYHGQLGSVTTSMDIYNQIFKLHQSRVNS